MLENSDSEPDVILYDDINLEQKTVTTDTERCTQAASSTTDTLTRSAANYSGLLGTDQLYVDSDESDGDFGIAEPKEQDGREKRRTEQFSQSLHQGMVLRSGSELKSVKSFLDHRESSQRRSSHLTSLSSADLTNNALNVHAVSREKDDLNFNNNARRVRHSSKSPVKTRVGRHGTGRRIIYDKSGRQVPTDYEEYRQFRLKHMYDFDRSDFSDSDSYSYTSSFTSTDSNFKRGAGKKRHSYFTQSLMLIMILVTSVVKFFTYVVKGVSAPVRACLLRPASQPVGRLSEWLWRQVNRMVTWFIVLDMWMVSRNSRRNCCLCLPLLLLIPFLVGGCYYLMSMPPGSQLFAFPNLFPQEKTVINLQQGGDQPHAHQEVKQIIRQMHADRQDLLTRADIDTLVRGILNPEIESLKVNVLNLAKEGSSDQTVLKVNQHDSRQRLLALEEQMAALLAKTKILDRDQEDMKTLFMETFTDDRDKQAEYLTSLRMAQADLKSQIDSLHSVYSTVVADSKKRCMDDNAMVDTIQKQVTQKVVEMLGEGGRLGQGAVDSDLPGWLADNYVDHDELDKELRLLMAEVTDKINTGIKSQSTDRGSSFFRSAGTGAVNEENIRLIVEDALLKYSADRTGLPDFALETAGGSVLNDRCSETYVKKTAVLSVFGIPLFYLSNSPRSVIQPDVYPGQCWAFKGDRGHVMIQLAVPIRPTGFSVEHIPRSLSIHGSIDSAPRDFSVIGLKSESDKVGLNLGNFSYQTVGTPIQHFDVLIRNPGVFAYVELRVLNNHGNKDYTCLYRFRVHGVPQP